MAWVRIHDGAMGNLKILRLSNSAFRLWVRGLCYCQLNLTDGLIPREALREMGAKRQDVTDLSTAQVEGRSPLWESIKGFGFKVHDYLIWNDSREVVTARQRAVKDRKDAWKEKKREERVRNASGTRPATRPEHDSGNAQPNQTKPNLTKEVQKQKIGNGSKRPIFDGERFVVFEWQLDELCKMLGTHAEAFDLHAWFFEADGKAKASGLVRDRRDWWPWLQQETLGEAIRRGLPVATAGSADEAAWAAIVAKGPSDRNRF